MPGKEPRVSKTRKRETKDEDAEKQSKEKQRKRTNIPLEVNLVGLCPRQNPLAPELRLKKIFLRVGRRGKVSVSKEEEKENVTVKLRVLRT